MISIVLPVLCLGELHHMWPKLDIMATNTVPYAHCRTFDVHLMKNGPDEGHASLSIACLVSRAHISAPEPSHTLDRNHHTCRALHTEYVSASVMVPVWC